MGKVLQVTLDVGRLSWLDLGGSDKLNSQRDQAEASSWSVTYLKELAEEIIVEEPGAFELVTIPAEFKSLQEASLTLGWPPSQVYRLR